MPAPLDLNAPITAITWRTVASECITEHMEMALDIGDDETGLFTVSELATLRAAIQMPRLTDSAIVGLYYVVYFSHEMALDAFYDENDPAFGGYVSDLENLRDLLAMEAGHRNLILAQ